MRNSSIHDMLGDHRAGHIGRRALIQAAGAAGLSISATADLVRRAAAAAVSDDSGRDGTPPARQAAIPAPVSFFLNGAPVTIDAPPPDLLLIDWLRSPSIGLAGPKKGCGQGGCGSCTVILSEWSAADGEVVHRAINSCLRPVCLLGGAAITTVEGTGLASRSAGTAPTSAGTQSGNATPRPGVGSGRAPRLDTTPAIPRFSHAGADPVINPVAYQLAANNGTQCGYCSCGIVMNITEFLANNPDATKKQIEDALDGNICRCTGYRPILTGMKTFASDWSEEDEANRMHCDMGAVPSGADEPLRIPIPDALANPAGRSVRFASDRWHAPATIAELGALLASPPNAAGRVRLVHANTGFGIYPKEFVDADLWIDIRALPELNEPPKVSSGEVRVSAGTTYSQFIALLERVLADEPAGASGPLGACLHMARRTAGRMVRNAATIGGNTMLTLAHIAPGTGDWFPSDLLTAFAAVGATVEYIEFRRQGTPTPGSSSVIDLCDAVAAGRIDHTRLLLTAYRIPRGAGSVALAQKVALREVNAHSLVNHAGSLRFSTVGTIEDATIVFAGFTPCPWRPSKTEAAMRGGQLTPGSIGTLCRSLDEEVSAAQRDWATRASENVEEGITAEYQRDLAVGLFYRTLIHAMNQRGDVPRAIASAGDMTWGSWPVSTGRQYFDPGPLGSPIGDPLIKRTALHQATGNVRYTQELACPPLTLNAAYVLSRRALGRFAFTTPGAAPASNIGYADGLPALREHLTAAFPTFVDLVTAEDIGPNGLNRPGFALDQPVFAEGEALYDGQSLAVVLAMSEQDAILIAEHVSTECVAWFATEWPAPFDRPLLTIEEAIAAGSIFPDTPATAPWIAHIWKITRPGSQLDWRSDRDPLDRTIVQRSATIDGVQCAIIESSQRVGGQAHFYLEPQIAIVEPIDVNRFQVRASTQSPDECHQSIAMALGVRTNQIEVKAPHLGGGFGGKTEPSRYVAAAAAVAARSTGMPVRLSLTRETDSALVGKRHSALGHHQIAVDTGAANPADRGLIRGWSTSTWADGGAYYDCSFAVSDCLVLGADNYRVRNYEISADVVRTNTAPNTAFRSFGAIQAKCITEAAIDDAAFVLGMTAEDLREKNLYLTGDSTPAGQSLLTCYQREVWGYLKERTGLDAKRSEVDAFNLANRWRKRGVAMIPVKYAAGYNYLPLEQATAFAAINGSDGAVTIIQGGVEMGQGLLTVIQQVAASVLGIPMDLIHVESVNTGVIPNPVSTGASVGTPFYSEAVKKTCQTLRSRLAAFASELRDENGEAWCVAEGVDYWNHPGGWATDVEQDGHATLIWQRLVSHAYLARLGLTATETARITGNEAQLSTLTYKPASRQPDIPGAPRDADASISEAINTFTGFNYSAACAMVEIDVLTGETKVLSADIVYDMNWSVNPAINIGQIEGGFIQGLGYLTSERLTFTEEGERRGELTTTNTWRYKPPAAQSIPLEMNVWLFPRNDPSVAAIPPDRELIMRSKEVGEPPLVMSSSVFFAIRSAIRASRLERGLDGLFQFDAPATVQEVRRACAVRIEDLAAV